MKWLGFIMVFVLPFALIFYNLLYASLSLIIGLRLMWAAKKLAEEFILNRMIEDEEFWAKIVAEHGVILRDNDGNRYYPNSPAETT